MSVNKINITRTRIRIHLYVFIPANELGDEGKIRWE